MAFWGVEIKPGKPYTHNHDNSHGRLRISQATLGNGKSTNKSTVQCNVGIKAPVLLCHLIPNALETCHLELEFEEPHEVVFSVLGQRSVHLSGYYVDRPGRGRDLDGDETDSYGEDIAHTDSSGSFDGSYSDDEYESDFIDDDDVEMHPTSPRRKSGVVIEEIEEDDKLSNENANRRRLKKKRQLSDSDDGVDGSQGQGQLVVKHNSSAVLESEDEDGFPICFSSREQNVVKDLGNSNAKSDKQTAAEDMRKETATVSQGGISVRETGQPADTVLLSGNGQENSEKSKKKKKKKSKDGKALETASNAPVEEKASVVADRDKDEKEMGTHKDDGVQLGGANVETEGAGDDGKAKKKKKTKKSKTTEAGANVSVGITEECTTLEDIKEDASNDKMDQGSPVNGELDRLPNQSEVADPPVPSTIDTETSRKLKKKNKKKRAKDDRGSDAEGAGATAVTQTEAKKKRKNNNSTDKDLVPVQESGEQRKAEVAKAGLKTRTFSNGLVIEELSMGEPDGKKATPGKRVSVNYIGKLKNGKIFDSTVGKRPYTFHLGVGKVIKGWDVGVNGMRVGDKRRLTIPPSFGYGPSREGPIPPNSWLIFDVELVSVK